MTPPRVSSSSRYFTVERAARTLHRMSPCTPVSVPAKITWKGCFPKNGNLSSDEQILSKSRKNRCFVVEFRQIIYLILVMFTENYYSLDRFIPINSAFGSSSYTANASKPIQKYFLGVSNQENIGIFFSKQEK